MKVRSLKWRFYRKTGGPRGWGLRCKVYAPGCLLCEFYRYFDESGRFPTVDEVIAISDVILGNEPRKASDERSR